MAACPGRLYPSARLAAGSVVAAGAVGQDADPGLADRGDTDAVLVFGAGAAARAHRAAHRQQVDRASPGGSERVATDDELAAIRMHPDYSQQILEKVGAFQTLAHVASAHHERLDGRGYHRQLDGVEFPWAARLLAVADMCEAMAAKRPWWWHLVG